jgi:phage terminase large subunit
VREQERVEEWPATRIFYENVAAKKPLVVNVGGARSSKSYSIVQLFITKFFTERNKTFLTTRKTLPALRLTAYKVAVDLLRDRGLLRFLDHNRSERTLRNPYNGNFWVFHSIDDPEKIKSTEFNYIHMEEANEFSYDDFMILRLRLSGGVGPGERNHVYLSLNPSEEHGWIRLKLLESAEAEVIRSTYLDNPFLSAEYVRQIEALRDQDESYWKIYGLGEFAPVRELIFGAPEIVAQIPAKGEIIYGLDFGYNNPSVLLEITIDEWAFWMREIVHKSGLTNGDLIRMMNEAITPYEKKKRPIYADPSEPDRIEEIARDGFLVYGASNEVRAGIVFLKRFRRYSLAENVATNREFSSYKWRIDRLGNPTDEPLKFDDHAPCAARYAVYTHLESQRGDGYFFALSKHDVY